MDVKGGEACGVETECHFGVAICSLITEDRDARLGVERREGLEGCLIGERGGRRGECEAVGQAGVGHRGDVTVFGIGAGGIVPQALHPVCSVRPGLLKLGTRSTTDKLPAVVDGNVLGGGIRGHTADLVKEARWRAASGETGLEAVFV